MHHKALTLAVLDGTLRDLQALRDAFARGDDVHTPVHNALPLLAFARWEATGDTASLPPDDDRMLVEALDVLADRLYRALLEMGRPVDQLDRYRIEALHSLYNGLRANERAFGTWLLGYDPTEPPGGVLTFCSDCQIFHDLDVADCPRADQGGTQ